MGKGNIETVLSNDGKTRLKGKVGSHSTLVTQAKTPTTDINSVSFDKVETKTNNFTRPQIGDILCSMWGYDQTNVHFYRVSALNGSSMLTLERLENENHGPDGFLSYSVSPGDKVMIRWNDAKGVNAPLVSKHKIQTYGNSFYVKISQYEYAYPWDGSPKSETHTH